MTLVIGSEDEVLGTLRQTPQGLEIAGNLPALHPMLTSIRGYYRNMTDAAFLNHLPDALDGWYSWAKPVDDDFTLAHAPTEILISPAPSRA